jgi:hypothetical protein
MGQYYVAIILADNDSKKAEHIKAYLESFGESGQKLIEHSYINNGFVNTLEFQLTKDGMFYKSRVVWAGDYADNEVGSENNLHKLTHELPDKCLNNLKLPIKSAKEYRYIINHTKKQYVDKEKQYYHPLPLLTAEGNGRGGGDYYGQGEKLVGTWARNVISIEKEIPEGYTKLDCKFG